MEDLEIYLISDQQIDTLYPVNLQPLSAIHWTPVEVTRKAAGFLAETEASTILDIGAGAGKFCIAASILSPASFTGIEIKKNLVSAGNKVINHLGVKNTQLIHGNFTELDLNKYSGLYFYNSFHENLIYYDEPDDSAGDPQARYDSYTKHLFEQLINMPSGTRLATYWLSVAEVPGCYRLLESHFDDKLMFWVKTDQVKG